MMEMEEGRAIVKAQAMPEGRKQLSPQSSDEEIDEIVRERGK